MQFENSLENFIINSVLISAKNFTYTELSSLPAEEYHSIIEILNAKGQGEKIRNEREKRES